MKKTLLIIVILLLGAGAYLWQEGKELHEVRTEIDIAAPPEKVWAIISDIDAWQEWNPIINASKGVAAEGYTLSITMVGKDGVDGPKYFPTIKHFEEPKYFHWQAEMITSAIMTNDKVFELEAIPSGTRLVHKELFTGMMVPIFCNKFDENVPPMLNSMNQALKELAEK